MGKGALEITLHAIERYQQRVENVPACVVIQRLRGPAFDAADFLGSASPFRRTRSNGGANESGQSRQPHPERG
jgi:hypothetical protein